jgi:TonB family protein
MRRLVLTGCALASVAPLLWSQEAGRPSGPEWAAMYDPHKNPKPDLPWMKDLVKFVAVDYPEWSEGSRLEGAGIFRAVVDPKTGAIIAVTPLKSTGYKVLDDAAAVTIKQWRMKPNSWKEIYVPISYQFYRRH